MYRKWNIGLVFFALMAVLILPAQGQIQTTPKVKVNPSYFQGGSKLTDSGPNGLAAIIRKMAQDAARDTVRGATSQLTNSIGIAPHNDFTVHATEEFTAYTESGTSSLSTTDFDAFLDKVADAANGIGAQLNTYNNYLGLPAYIISGVSGTSAHPSIELITVDFTPASSTLVSVTQANIRLTTVKNVVRTLAEASNRIAKAVGFTPLTINTGGSLSVKTANDGLTYGQLYLENIYPSVASGGLAGTVVQVTEAETVCTSIAKNLSTIVDFLNAITIGYPGDFVALGGASGGSASATYVLAEIADPEAFTHVSSTDLYSLTHVTLAMDYAEKDLTILTTRVNKLLAKFNLPALGGITNAASSTTILSVTDSTVGADGAASDAAVYSQFLTAVQSTRNNIATLTYSVNQLLDIYGLTRLTDSTGGIRGTSGAMLDVDVAFTGGDGTAGTGVSQTAADTIMSGIGDALATLQERINTFTSTAFTYGMQYPVVAD